MKAFKLIGGLLAATILVVAVGGYFLVSNLDGIVKDVVEDVGSQLTQTTVSLEAVNLSLTSGTGQLTGLTIGNPEGFNSDYAFRLDNVALGIDLTSLTGPVIVISEVTIDGASLIAEQRGETTNLSEIMKNVQQASSKAESAPAKNQEPSEATDVRLMIEQFNFTNTQGEIIPEGFEQKALTLPDVRRTNIGDKETGLTPTQLADELLQTVMKQVEKAVGQYLSDLAMEAMEKKLREKVGLDTDESTIGTIKSWFKKGE